MFAGHWPDDNPKETKLMHLLPLTELKIPDNRIRRQFDERKSPPSPIPSQQKGYFTRPASATMASPYSQVSGEHAPLPYCMKVIAPSPAKGSSSRPATSLAPSLGN